MSDEDSIKSFRWAGRPLRHLTNGELDQAISERESALSATQAGTTAADLIRVALDRLYAERDGRDQRRTFG